MYLQVMLVAFAVAVGSLYIALRPIYFAPFHSPFHLTDVNGVSHTFCNFDRRQCCDGALFTPASIDEVQRLVAEATAANQKVRVVGAGHSMSAVVCGDLAPNTSIRFISLDALDRILDVDREAGVATVEAGLRLKNLNLQLAAQNLSLHNMGLIDEQSVGGLTSTGVHGTGVQFTTVSGAVRGLTLVAANGSLVELNASENEDIFRFARLHLGVFGVIVKVTIAVRPLVHLRREQRYERFEDALASFDRNVDSQRHFQMWLVTYTDMVQMNDMVEIAAEEARAIQRPEWVVTAEKLATDVAFLLMTLMGNWVPAADTLMFQLLPYAQPPKVFGGQSREILTFPGINFHSVRYTETEYFLPRANAVAAIRASEKFVAEERIRCPVNAFHPIRTVKGDDIPHSPAFRQDSVTISFVMVNRAADFDECSKRMEEIFLSFGGRPHWGKRHSLNATTAAKLYGEQTLSSLRKAVETTDPTGTFMTPAIDALLPR